MFRAGMSELADEADSKSVVGNYVRVLVPLPAVNFLKRRAGKIRLSFHLFYHKNIRYPTFSQDNFQK